MQIRIAKFISYALHPLLMPSILLLIVFSSDSYIQLTTPFKIQKIIFVLVLFTTILLPVVFSFFLLKNGLISSMSMNSKEERRLPYLNTCLFYFFTFYLLKQVHVSSLIYLLFLGAAVALLLTMLINLRWKISAHMVGIGGLIGALLGISIRLGIDYQLLILSLIVVAGIIGTARLLLNSHSPAQIYGGFLLGVVSQIALFLIV